MILSVGYRVNSKRGIAFRKWANDILKRYILKGYAINVLSNKRTYIEDKDSENGELRVEEENAWKMVSRVHSIVLVLVMVLGGLYLYSEIW